MNSDVRSELAPSGTLRAAINLANFLLVTGRTPDGDPEGVAPDMAAEIAKRLEVPITYVPFETPARLADAAGDDVWDIGLIGAEPARAETIAFTAAYTEIEATYVVPAGSGLREVEEVDRDGVRIAVAGGSAYDLFLSRSLEHAELVRASGLDGSFDLFVEEELDALAGSARASSPTWSAFPERASSTGGSPPSSRRSEPRVRASGGPRSSPSSWRKRRRAGSCSASSTGTASAASRWRPRRSGRADVPPLIGPPSIRPAARRSQEGKAGPGEEVCGLLEGESDNGAPAPFEAGDEGGGEALNGIAPRLVGRLAGRPVGLALGGRQLPKPHPVAREAHADRRFVRRASGERDRGEHPMIAPGETFEVGQNLGAVARLAEDLPIDDNDGVRAEHRRRRAFGAGGAPPLHRVEARESLLAGHPLDVADRRLPVSPALVDRNVQHLEPVTEPREKLPPAR